MPKVYVLQHERDTEDGADTKLVGIYGSEEQAKEALERARERPGFIDHQGGFSIDGYELGRDQWESGFVSVEEDRTAEPDTREANRAA